MDSNSTRTRDLILLNVFGIIAIIIGLLVYKIHGIRNFTAEANATTINTKQVLVSSIEPIEIKAPEIVIPSQDKKDEDNNDNFPINKKEEKKDRSDFENCKKLIKKLVPKNLSNDDIIKYSKSIIKYSKKYDLPYELIVSIIYHESTFGKKKLSKKGAIGLMQVVPKWHKDKLKNLKIDITRIQNYDNNINLGCNIISEYYIMHGSIKKALYSYLGCVNPSYATNILSTMVTHQIETKQGRS